MRISNFLSQRGYDDNFQTHDFQGILAWRDDSRESPDRGGGNARERAGGDRGLDPDRTAAFADLRPAADARRGVYVDARLLGVWERRLLLGARHLDTAACRRGAVDASLL